MNGFWIAVEYLMCVIDIGLAFLFSSKLLNMDENRSYRSIFIAAGLVATVIFLATYIELFSVWKIIIGLATYLAFTIYCYDAPLKDKILCVLLFQIILVISDIVATTLVILSHGSSGWGIVLEQGLERLIMFCIARITNVLIISLIVQFSQKARTKIPAKFWMIFLFSFSVLFIVSLLLLNAGLYEEASSNFNNLVMIIVFTILIFYFTSYYLFHYICGFFIKENETNLLEYQNDLIEKYIIQKQESDKIIKIMSHDLKHNILSWRLLAEKEENAQILKEISDYERWFNENRIIDVENEIANAIINQKFFEARKNDIAFDVLGTFYQDIAIDNRDLCALLGNLLDNALEASVKVKNPKERKIEMRIKRKGTFLLIEVINTFEVTPVLKNKIFITSKKNRGLHGIGITSILEVTKRYNGTYENSFEENIFKSTVLLRGYN